jgi:hypothetical protein
VVIDGKKNSIEIQLGDKKIGDKCYTRVGTDVEEYFDNAGDSREEIVAQGMEILANRLKNIKIAYPDGRDYDWR